MPSKVEQPAKTPSKVDQNSIRRRGVGLIASDPDKVSPGYVLVAPLTSNQVRTDILFSMAPRLSELS